MSAAARRRWPPTRPSAPVQPRRTAILGTRAVRAAGLVLVLVGLIAVVLASRPGRAWAAPAPQLSVRSAILVEPTTGQVLYGARPQEEVAIASATKLMTALLTLEHVRELGTVFTQNNFYPAAVDSQIGLVPGERMTVHDLLLALMLPSADDAAEDLAYNLGHGSVSRFVGMMNARARVLGLHHTNYTTPSGLDTPGNYSTAADLVKLAGYDLGHSPYFARIVALPHAVLHSGNHVRYVINRNTLVSEYPWVNGVKTGHTGAAGYVLVASGHRDGMTLLSAVLGTSSEAARDANTLALLDYGFANFRRVTPIRAGEVLARPTVAYRTGEHAALVAATGLTRVIALRAGVRVRVQAPAQLTGPVPRHARLGTAVVLVGGRPVARIPLLLARALPAVSSLTIAARFITRPLMLVILVLAAAVSLALAFGIRQRRRARAGGGGLEAA
ncbi:MAG: D-alanyl-D-alanine carboxypeptidase family protein [Solirubrobacteraceae bacterium]